LLRLRLKIRLGLGSVLGLGLEFGLGFRVRVRIRTGNLIGGAGGAHILMTSYACTGDVIRIFYFGRKSAVFLSVLLSQRHVPGESAPKLRDSYTNNKNT